jgi:hypothetical protein
MIWLAVSAGRKEAIMTIDIIRRFANRFKPLFEKGGLKDVKFFLRPDLAAPTAAQLEEEALGMADACAITGKMRLITNFDRDLPEERYDAPFK